MKNYVEVAYQKSEKPYGEYPFQLAAYLKRRFYMKKGMKLLDNGCGRGEFLHAFQCLGLNVYGTDISDYCKAAKVLNMNTDKLPFGNEYFDVVFSKSVIEHIDNTEFYISEMKRVLKKDGVLILMVPDWETQYKIFYQDPTHIHPYTRKSIENLLLMFDFKDVNAEKFVQLPCVWNNRFMYGLSRFIRMAGPVKCVYKNKFIRFSRELMIMGSGVK